MAVENHVGLGPVSTTVTLTTPAYTGPGVTLGLGGAAQEVLPYNITVSRTGPANSDTFVILEIDDSAVDYIQHAWAVLQQGQTSATATYTPPDDGEATTGRQFTVRIGDVEGQYAYESTPHAVEVRQAPMGSSSQMEAATISGPPSFNDAGADGVFGPGETVEVTFTFDRQVLVDTSGGTPSVPVLLSGTAARQATYLRGSGASLLVFGYTLVDGDGEHSSLLIEPNALSLNGSAIRDETNNLAVDISHQGGGAVYLPEVEEEAELELQSATVDGATLTLTYNEVLDSSVTLPTSAFTVNVNGSSRSVDSVSVSGSAVTLTLSSAATAGDTVTVSYTKPDGASFIRDTRGRMADSFSAQEVSNDTEAGEAQRQSQPTQTPNSPATGSPTISGKPSVKQPLTASAHNVPDSHSGISDIVFELRLRETPVDDFSYKTLRDYAFTVTGGEVVRARRLDRPHNIRWEITVSPDSNGAVTIVLPVTTDCAAQGAICTEDGRMLSERMEIIVVGPAGDSD